ncbi:unnamed protein product, partial [Porites lobata]
DLELEHEGAAPGSTSQPVRRNISLKLKAKSKSASSLSSGKSKKKEGKSGEKSRTGSEGDKKSKRKQKSPGTAAAAQVVVMRELQWDHQVCLIMFGRELNLTSFVPEVGVQECMKEHGKDPLWKIKYAEHF